jgi:hypothetical protein
MTGTLPEPDAAGQEAQSRLAALFQSGQLAEPPARSPRLEQLTELAANGQRRARELLAGNRPTADPQLDLVRLLHESPVLAAGDTAQIARDADLTPAQLSRLRAACRYGGIAGAHVALMLHVPVTDEQMHEAEARVRTCASIPPPEPQLQNNRISEPGAGAEIRLGPDGCWYPFTSALGEWAPVNGRNLDPLAAYQAALKARRARG